MLQVGENRDIINPNSMTFEERQRQLTEEEKQEDERRKREKKSPYDNFVQVNKDYYKAEDWLMGKSPIAYRIFKFLINHMDSYNAVMCSYQVFQENFDISKPTVTRAIKLLKDKKYIQVYKSGSSNVYAVNKEIAWNSWGTNFKYAKFGANIIISESEQENSEIKTEKVKQVNIKNKNDRD